MTCACNVHAGMCMKKMQNKSQISHDISTILNIAVCLCTCVYACTVYNVHVQVTLGLTSRVSSQLSQVAV